MAGFRAYQLLALPFLIVGTLSSAPAFAQDAPEGRIVGKVVDAQTGSPLADVGVQVVGTTLGSATGIDGSFTVARVPAGSITIHVRRLGYQPKTITGLTLTPGGVLQQDVSLTRSVAQIAELRVTAASEKGSVESALDTQRNATAVVNSVTSEQISRSPDGDAAQAVQRVSGVTTEDNKVFVRGLGGRYTTTSLNNTRVPSPEPETRVVPLDMFPAGLLQSITTYKTFTPEQQGDFAGAVVDIKTKEFPAQRSVALQLGSGFATGATGASLITATSAGGERFGMVNHGRDLPSELRGLGNFQNASLTQGDMNRLVGTFRNSWSPFTNRGSPLLNGSASIGGNDPVFGHRIGYLLSGTLSSSTDIKDNEQRAMAYPGGSAGQTLTGDPFVGRSASQSVLWGGMANLSTLIGRLSRVSFNGMYNRTADNTARVEDGFFTYDAIPVRLTRMQYVQRGLFSAQLAGEHNLGVSHKIDWRATASGVRRFEPDRSEFAQVFERDSANGPEVLRWLTGGSGGAVRTFSDLNETSGEYAANYQLDVRPLLVKVGGLYRQSWRDAESFSYVISARNATNAMRELPPEAIFDGRFSGPTDSVLTLGPLSQGGSYTANDRLGAGYVQVEAPIGRLRMIGGARYESDHLDVRAVSTLGTPVNPSKIWNDLLPSLALTMQLTETQQLRLSVARTLARPEYREVTPIISRDVIGGENVQGDVNLTRTNITSADLRWETYPTPGEIFGVSLFAKHFTRPIEQVYGSSSGGTSYVFFTNAKGADDYGVEVEARRNLRSLADALAPVTVFTNATVMESRIQLSPDNQASATNQSRRMVGQAPYVVNSGVTWAPLAGTWSGTFLYNRIGPRITAAGSIPLPDVVEQPRDVLDFSLRFRLTNRATGRFDARNLLDSPHEVLQGSVTRVLYHTGRTLQAGILMRP